MKWFGFLVLAACSGGDSDSDDSGSSAIETIGWDIDVLDALEQPVSGATVCTDAGCETSSASGAIHLELPIGESSLTIEGDGLVSTLMGLTIVDTPPSPDRLIALTEAFADLLFSDVGTVDWSKSHIVGQVIGAEGSVPSMDPAGGEGPFYIDENQLGIDGDLTGVGPGRGYAILNIDATGDVEISHTGLGSNCANSEWSQAGSSSERTKVELRAGFTSTTEVVCP